MLSWGRYGPARAPRKAPRLINALADIIWPPVSLLSYEPVSAHGQLSPADWSKISFLDRPWCETCGFPFQFPVGEGAVCGPCAARQPAFDTARSAFVYAPESRQLVLSLKHGGRVDGLAAFGGWMKRAGADVLEGADLLVPVPLHGRRLRQRRFNQSLLLARALTKLTGIRTDPHLLLRTRATPSQGGQSAKGRRRNVAGAFAVRPGRKATLEGAHIVIIDDVYTTGATLEACARALKRAGAARVDALTLARVVKPADVIT